MADRKKRSGKSLLSLLFGIPTPFSILRRSLVLVGLEARLAWQGVLHLIIYMIMLAILSAITWICILLLLFVSLISMGWSVLSALLLVSGLNILLLIIITVLICRTKNRLNFKSLKREARHLRRFYDEI